MAGRTSPPRRALLVSHSYYLRDTRFRRHAEALAEDGWEVEALCARDAGELPRERVGPVEVHRLPARRRRGSKARYVLEYASFGGMALARIAALHLRRRYRLVYVFSIPNLLVLSALAPRLAGARVILDVRDPMPEFFRSKYGLEEDHRLVRALLAEERLACRYASRVVTVHEALADLLLRTGVGRERISVVMNAPDPRLFAAAGARAASPARDPHDRTVLYAGTVATRYGVDLLVRAVARLHREIPALRLRIVGDGDAVPALRALARQLGVADRVGFDGPVPLDAIPGIVRGSWLGAQPHRDDPLMRYCFSTKVLEWCALGLPVVCSDTEAFARAFGDEEVLLVPPGDLDALCKRISEAHADPAALAGRAARAQAGAHRYDWTRERAALLAAAGGSAAPYPRPGARL